MCFKGLKQAHLTVDLPFMSYQISPAQALESAGRLVQEGQAQSVKARGWSPLCAPNQSHC